MSTVKLLKRFVPYWIVILPLFVFFTLAARSVGQALAPPYLWLVRAIETEGLGIPNRRAWRFPQR
jgi:hypothetical protein